MLITQFMTVTLRASECLLDWAGEILVVNETQLEFLSFMSRKLSCGTCFGKQLHWSHIHDFLILKLESDRSPAEDEENAVTITVDTNCPDYTVKISSQ
jgi:hypothetical protein